MRIGRIVIGLFGVVLIGLICTESPFSFLLIVGIIAMWMLTGVVLTFAVFVSHDSNTAPKWQYSWTLLLAKVSCAIVAGVYLGELVYEWQERRVREFVAHNLPVIDRFRSEKGVFPNTLAQVGISSIPSVGWETLDFAGNESEFRFGYGGRGFSDGWAFSSDNRKWVRRD